MPDLSGEQRAGYNATQKQGESYHALMERYQMCDVLVFDDLGAEKLTDWVEEQFYLLVDYRYRQRLARAGLVELPQGGAGAAAGSAGHGSAAGDMYDGGSGRAEPARSGGAAEVVMRRKTT